ncbi:hypothetical protein ILUMI_04350 [Ignelater luminosus]|uniref:Uncharacterized protein n=1 Tax=Ignelater luminosus TaxID=2038154 RepID=A0A8K0D9V8_IGNLU|nr:hypothetical protein ILUMI_04350 [Ignelater luminosus]
MSSGRDICIDGRHNIVARQISSWAKIHDDAHIFCLVCQKVIKDQSDFCKIEQHAEGKHHMHQVNTKLNLIQLKLYAPGTSSSADLHLESFFIGHATAEILSDHILKSINNSGLTLNKLLMLSADGPNVNKKVFRLINEKVKEVRNKELIDIGSCNIHVMHNAFRKGLQKVGNECAEFVISVFYFFNDWPARREDYAAIQTKMGITNHNFLKHVPTRWLTIEPAITRILEQFESLKYYVLNYLPKHAAKTTLNSSHYLQMKLFLKKADCKATLQYVKDFSQIFSKFTAFFQREEPLIHLMFDQLKEILMSMFIKICKQEIIIDFSKLDINKIFASENLLDLKNIDLGDTTKELIRNLPEKDQLQFLSKVKDSLITSATYIVYQIPLIQSTLRYLSVLNPRNVKNNNANRYLRKCLEILPYEVDITTVLDEFKLFKLEDLDFSKSSSSFWFEIDIQDSEGNPKYKTLLGVVKNLLTLSHGNASVEQGFSLSGHILP